MTACASPFMSTTRMDDVRTALAALKEHLDLMVRREASREAIGETGRTAFAPADSRATRHDRHRRRDRDGPVPGQFAGGAHSGTGRDLQVPVRRGHGAAVDGGLSEMAVAHPTAGSFGVYAEHVFTPLGRLHGALHLLGGAVHRHRRRSGGHRDLLPVVVSRNAEMALDPGLLLRAALRQCAERGQFRQLRILVRHDQGGARSYCSSCSEWRCCGARLRACDRLLKPHRARRLPANGMAAACGWPWSS